MSDADVVRNALGTGNVHTGAEECKPVLVYDVGTKPTSLKSGTMELYKLLLEEARKKGFAPFAVGELKVFLKEIRPEFTPAQAINRLETSGLMISVSGTKSSRTDPPFRAVVRRPVCEFQHETNVFIPDECLPHELPPQPEPLPDTLEQTITDVATSNTSRIKSKGDLESDLALLDKESKVLEDQWETRRSELQEAAIASEREIAQLEATLEQRREQLEREREALDGHLETRPDGLKEVNHKRLSLQMLIAHYDEFTPLLFGA